MSKWEMNPIIKAHHTISMSTNMNFPSTENRKFVSTPNSTTPIKECEIHRCPPKKGVKTLPITFPAGSRPHKSAVGWSISGASPPIKQALSATSAVANVIFGMGFVATITDSAVNANKSCVRPVIVLL